MFKLGFIDKPASGYTAPLAYDLDTEVLLHLDGDNLSTNIVDEIGHTFTAFGGAHISTDPDAFGGALASFNGSTDYIYGTSPHFAIYGEATIDFRVQISAVGDEALVDCRTDPIASYICIYTSNGQIRVKTQEDSTRIIGTTLLADTDYHIALVMHELYINLYVNGVAQPGTYQMLDSLSEGDIWIGGDCEGMMFLNGKVNEFRYSSNARWLTDFTPPASAYVPDQKPWYAVTANTLMYCPFEGNGYGAYHTMQCVPSNVTYVEGKLHLGALFNGTTSYADVAVGLLNGLAAADFSLIFSFNPTSLSIQSFLSVYVDANSEGNIYIDGTGRLRLYFRFGGSYVADYISVNPLPLSTGTPFTFIIIRSGTSFHLYIENVEIPLTETVSVGTFNFAAYNHASLIGAYNDLSKTMFLDGVLDEWIVETNIAWDLTKRTEYLESIQ